LLKRFSSLDKALPSAAGSSEAAGDAGSSTTGSREAVAGTGCRCPHLQGADAGRMMHAASGELEGAWWFA
jgi:hypothetical protein